MAKERVDQFPPNNEDPDYGLPLPVVIAAGTALVIAAVLSGNAGAQELTKDPLNADKCAEMGFISKTTEPKRFHAERFHETFSPAISKAAEVKLSDADKSHQVSGFKWEIRALKPMTVSVRYDSLHPGKGFAKTKVDILGGGVGEFQTFVDEALGEGNHSFKGSFYFNEDRCIDFDAKLIAHN